VVVGTADRMAEVGVVCDEVENRVDLGPVAPKHPSDPGDVKCAVGRYPVPALPGGARLETLGDHSCDPVPLAQDVHDACARRNGRPVRSRRAGQGHRVTRIVDLGVAVADGLDQRVVAQTGRHPLSPVLT
jgi:hypothetical protein